MASRKQSKPTSEDAIRQGRLMSHFVWLVRCAMLESRLTKAELAASIKKPLKWVRDFLDGAIDDVDMRTVSDIMLALNRRFKVTITPSAEANDG